jgi:linoleoyl-CoA desaturase
MKHHPGGSLMLEASRGEDATAAFESYHAMCDMTKIKNIMAKYEVPNTGSIAPTPVRFEDGAFYRTLKDRVRNHFKSSDTSHHANWFWVVKSALQVGLFVSSFMFFCFRTDYSILARSIAAMFAGHMFIQCGFGVMHDASHHAISTNPIINERLASCWNTIALWDNRIWYKHHCIMHHSFTGSEVDPDTIHYAPFIRKSADELYRKYRFLSTTYPYFTFLLTIFPGMFFGQTIAYLRGRWHGGMWRFTLPRRPTDWFESTLRITTILCLVSAARTHILIPIMFFISANFWYSIAIIPDHDTFETELNLVRDISNTDWGEVQVRNSGDFSTDNPYTVNFLGGINYQIEHHLFPTICHVHLPEVAKIVRVTCEEYDIPYVCHPTIISAYLDALKKFSHLAIEQKPKN